MISIINPNYRPQADDTSIEADIYLFNLTNKKLPYIKLLVNV